jgi:protocatechuate 3,4-dioxygenase alpha subunit
MSLQTTSSQTIGPYLHIGTDWLNTPDLLAAGGNISGERITIEGRVFDGDAKPVTDALIEIWQANANGRYAHPEDAGGAPLEPAFRGFGRVPTDGAGGFRFVTVKPGRVPGPDGRPQAPHIVVAVFARGLLKHLATRLYFADGEGNADDAVLNMVPADRRATLVARAASGKPGAYEWNIVLQGEAAGQGETVFFDL